jgi:hypothetical protein
MEQWTTSMRRRVLPARQEQGEALTTLLRQCDANTLMVGRQCVAAPNAFVIELLGCGRLSPRSGHKLPALTAGP